MPKNKALYESAPTKPAAGPSNSGYAKHLSSQL